jgi:hypothetical protein
VNSCLQTNLRAFTSGLVKPLLQQNPKLQLELSLGWKGYLDVFLLIFSWLTLIKTKSEHSPIPVINAG